jgi:hypothetical protein
MNMRETIAQDMQSILSNPKEFGLPLELVGPDGVEQTGLYGFITYARVNVTETGNEVMVRKPVVTVSKRDLNRIPLSTDFGKWICRIPDRPYTTESLTTYVVEQVLAGGDSFDFVQLHLTAAEQTP